MNPKIKKTINEIEKTKTKIAELQARLRELEVLRVDLENTEIVSLFRSVDVAPEELAGFIKAYKEQSVQPAYTSGYQSALAYEEEEEGLLDEE